jgi:hypothetical protein
MRLFSSRWDIRNLQREKFRANESGPGRVMLESPHLHGADPINPADPLVSVLMQFANKLWCLLEFRRR